MQTTLAYPITPHPTNSHTHTQFIYSLPIGPWKISPTVAKNGSFALNKTKDGGITVDFWIVKVHTSD